MCLHCQVCCHHQNQQLSPLHRFNQTCIFKPILHYALGLRFGKVCKQKHEKNTRKTREKNARKKREPVFNPTHSVI